jgi:hypothetical protein
VDHVEYAQWFEKLPERIETVSILNTVIFPHLVKVLVVLWVLGMWRCLRGRHPARDWSTAMERFMLDAWFALTVFLLARNEWLKSRVFAVAYWAALCGGWWDAFKMLFAFALAFKGRMISGIGLSITYVVWTALREIPERISIFELPDWWEFRKNLERAARARWGRYARGPEDDCQVCGLINRRPCELPCNRSHLICMDCVTRLRAEDKNYCPTCRRPLYRMQADERAFYNIVIACLCTVCVFKIIAVGLKVYRGFYREGRLATLLFAPILIGIALNFKPWHTIDEDFVAQWPEWVLGQEALCLVIWACCEGRWLGAWDQLTYVDGKVGG